MLYKRKYVLIGACVWGCIYAIVLIVLIILRLTPDTESDVHKIVINLPELERNDNFKSLYGTYVMSEEEFDEYATGDGTMSFESYEDYLADISKTELTNSTATFEVIKEHHEIKMPDTSTITNVKGANAKLFNYCDMYFKCFYGSKRVSPIFPMALANVETPGRANNDITWSALFPSAVVSVDLMDTFNVADIAADMVKYRILTQDYSTRDRGPLQMSPTYGSSLDAGLGMNERDKVKEYPNNWWTLQCSSSPGDRFYLPDMLLRLQVAMEANCANIVRNGYTPETEAELIAQLAVSHNSGSGIWACTNPSYGAGNWPSAQQCYNLCKQIGSDAFVDIIYKYALTHNTTYIDRNVGMQLWREYSDESLSSYCKSQINAVFPILCLYSYVKLSLLYTG